MSAAKCGHLSFLSDNLLKNANRIFPTLFPASEIESGIKIYDAEIVRQSKIPLIVLINVSHRRDSGEKAVVVIHQTSPGYEVKVEIMVSLVVY